MESFAWNEVNYETAIGPVLVKIHFAFDVEGMIYFYSLVLFA